MLFIIPTRTVFTALTCHTAVLISLMILVDMQGSMSLNIRHGSAEAYNHLILYLRRQLRDADWEAI